MAIASKIQIAERTVLTGGKGSYYAIKLQYIIDITQPLFFGLSLIRFIALSHQRPLYI